MGKSTISPLQIKKKINDIKKKRGDAGAPYPSVSSTIKKLKGMQIENFQHDDVDMDPEEENIISSDDDKTLSISKKPIGSSRRRNRPISSQNDDGELPDEKANRYGIDLGLVCTHPMVKYLRQCVEKINTKLPSKSSRRLSRKGTKATLLKEIFDFFGVHDDQRGPTPMTASQKQQIDTTIFYSIDRAYEEALIWRQRKKNSPSMRSFEDCTCARCDGLPWADEAPNNSSKAAMQPKIPRIFTIKDAIQQWEDGTVEKYKSLYYKTDKWRGIKKPYSERKVW